jgi:hypothetical protein
MPDQPENSEATKQAEFTSRDTAWVGPVTRLQVGRVSPGAVNLNIQGRQVTSPIRGFGQMWQKTYTIRLDPGTQVKPSQVIHVWRHEFGSFWPKGNKFFGAEGEISPGDVAVLHLGGPGGVNPPGGYPLISTGILVVYADEESFSFLTPEGHPFSAMITFSSYEEQGQVVIKVQALIRASDPLYEFMVRIGLGHQIEDRNWIATCQNLAARFGTQSKTVMTKELIDPRVQWSEAKNIWKSAAIRTTFYTLAAPFRWAGRKIRRKLDAEKDVNNS